MNLDSNARMWLALGLGLAAALGNVLGGFFVVRREWPRRSLTYFLALGAGFMLATALVEMVPEAIRISGDEALFFVLAGYFLVHLFEHTLAPHFHFGEETHHAEMRHLHASMSALAGLMTHTFFDGVAIASGFLVSEWLGIVIFLAVFLHKLPEGFTVASLLLASGKKRNSALLGSALLGAATLLGVLLTWVLKATLAYTLPISAGVTLYVSATDLMPEVNRETGVRISVVAFLGVALLFVLHRFFNV
jgi:ZIP family zinc transporter/zinc and cadmium transporter